MESAVGQINSGESAEGEVESDCQSDAATSARDRHTLRDGTKTLALRFREKPYVFWVKNHFAFAKHHSHPE